MFQKTRAVARKYGAKLGAGVATMAVGASAFAQTSTNPIVTLLGEISLDGVAAAIAAVCVVLVAIALTLKGPDVAKRVIRKV